MLKKSFSEEFTGTFAAAAAAATAATSEPLAVIPETFLETSKLTSPLFIGVSLALSVTVTSDFECR